MSSSSGKHPVRDISSGISAHISPATEPALHPPPPKRRRTYPRQFPDYELLILHAAAEILGVPFQQLPLALRRPPSDPSFSGQHAWATSVENGDKNVDNENRVRRASLILLQQTRHRKKSQRGRASAGSGSGSGSCSCSGPSNAARETRETREITTRYPGNFNFPAPYSNTGISQPMAGYTVNTGNTAAVPSAGSALSALSDPTAFGGAATAAAEPLSMYFYGYDQTSDLPMTEPGVVAVTAPGAIPETIPVGLQELPTPLSNFWGQQTHDESDSNNNWSNYNNSDNYSINNITAMRVRDITKPYPNGHLPPRLLQQPGPSPYGSSDLLDQMLLGSLGPSQAGLQFTPLFDPAILYLDSNVTTTESFLSDTNTNNAALEAARVGAINPFVFASLNQPAQPAQPVQPPPPPRPPTPQNPPDTQLVVAPRKRRRRAFEDPREREATANTRRMGACTRCQACKVRCISDKDDPLLPCQKCIAAGTVRQRGLCMRDKVTDISLFAKGEHPQYRWSQRWSRMEIVEITDWASDEIREIKLSQDVCGLAYTLQVRRFNPRAGDATERRWVDRDGREYAYKCAPFAIVNMVRTGEEFRQFVDRNIETMVRGYIDEKDVLLWETYQMVVRYSKCSENPNTSLLLRKTLQLWVATRMESRSERIIGPETLGQPPQNDDRSANTFGHVLPPPVLSAQIELLTTVALLRPLRNEVLACLKKVLEDAGDWGGGGKGKKWKGTGDGPGKGWWASYLCTFVVLHSCALYTRFERMQAKKYGLLTRYVYDRFVNELHTGANVLLAYFHHVNRGVFPFSTMMGPRRMSTSAAAANLATAGLTDEQVEFVAKTASWVEERDTEFKDVRRNGNYEHDYYFLSQLYDLDWKPTHTDF